MPSKVTNRKAREYALARKHHTWKIPLWSAVGKICKAAAAPNLLPSGTNAGAGEGI
jgi:hypothetical protein